MAILWLHEPSADHVEGLLGGPLADSFSVATEGALYRVGLLGVGEGYVDQAYGLAFCVAGGAGDAGDSQSQSCAGGLADACGEGTGHKSGPSGASATIISLR